MKFSELTGQKEIGSRIRQAVNENRIPHAQLFAGAEGSGALALALAYCQYIHCENRNADDSCGECSSCRKHEGLIHPDLHFSFPFPSNLGDSASELYSQWRQAIKANPYLNYEMWMQNLQSENKQGNISRKECRAIIKSLSLKAFEGGYKIMLMWMPEYLGAEGNILLKIIEEPPENTLFLMVAEDSDSILTTILSRAQITRIPPVKDEFISAKLAEVFNLSADESNRIALMSSGNYLKATELATNAENKFLDPFRTWMGYCYLKKMPEAINWSQEFGSQGREQLKGFFLYCLEITRAALVNPFLPGKTGLSAEEETFISKFSKILHSHAQAEIMYNLLNDAAYEVERNGNAKMIFTDLSFKLARILK